MTHQEIQTLRTKVIEGLKFQRGGILARLLSQDVTAVKDSKDLEALIKSARMMNKDNLQSLAKQWGI